jgi:cell division protein FtsI (penicillin-binding protein 3)
VADTSPPTWRPTLRRRLFVAAGVLLAWSVAIEARLVYLQVWQHDELSARAEQQQRRTIDAPAKRGEILDRHGRVLAYSVDADTVYAVPSQIKDAPQAAEALCRALGDCRARDRQGLLERLQQPRHFVYVQRQITPEQARRIAALDLAGIGFMKESRRLYPNRELAAHVLGYVGIDNVGLGGLEEKYDDLIKGEPGRLLIQIDGARDVFISTQQKPPTRGDTLELTIDQYLQHVAERELRAGVAAAGADGGTAIVMNPRNGEILALANYPTFNPNAYGRFSPDQRRNRGVQDLYEPGSTFKIVTAGAALEENVIEPDDLVNTSPGVIRFAGRVVDEADGHNYGVLSFADVIVKSSNVGAIKVGLRLGADRLSTYVRRFGFGRALSPDFRGESSGIVWRPEKLNDSGIASISMGYQVAVTPLQMAAATSAVANGGELIQPRVVRAVVRRGERIPVPRKVIGRAISQHTAAELTEIMEHVVVDGTGTRAQVAGYAVAGKTGTANKVVNGAYSPTDYNVSFAGFVPSRNPEYAIVVVVDSPHKVRAYGGVVAAPIFERIADAALRHEGIPPSNAEPPLVVAQRQEAPQLRQGGSVQPTAGRVAPPVVTLTGSAGARTTVFPDLTGMSARDALRTLTQLGLTPRLAGSGVVVEQHPAAGTPFDPGADARLRLARAPGSAGAATP